MTTCTSTELSEAVIVPLVYTGAEEITCATKKHGNSATKHCPGKHKGNLGQQVLDFVTKSAETSY